MRLLESHMPFMTAFMPFVPLEIPRNAPWGRGIATGERGPLQDIAIGGSWRPERELFIPRVFPEGGIL